MGREEERIVFCTHVCCSFVACVAHFSSFFSYNEEGYIYIPGMHQPLLHLYMHQPLSSNTFGRPVFAGGGHKYTQSVANVSTQSLFFSGGYMLTNRSNGELSAHDALAFVQHNVNIVSNVLDQL